MNEFRTLITNTCENWVKPDKLEKYIEDYLEVVAKSDLINQIGRFLETNSSNILNSETMPLIDLGDKPSTYDQDSTEAGQIFIVPKSQYPDRIIIKYGSYRSEYLLNKLPSKFKKS